MRRLLAVVLTLVAWVGLSGGAWGGAAPGDGRITGVQVAPGRVEFLFTGQGLDSSLRLEENSLRVTVDGEKLTANAAPASQAPTGARKRAVMIVLDTSGSMKGPDMAAAVAASGQLGTAVPDDVAIGLATTTAGVRKRVVLAPSTDRLALGAALKRVKAAGETALYDGITDAVAALRSQGQEADKRLVVLSDGKDTASKTTLARLAESLTGVTVDVVAFRTVATDTAPLQQIANASGGQLLASADSTKLAGAFASAASAINQTMLISVRIPTQFAGRPGRVDVRMTAGSTTVSASAPVTFAALPAGATPAAAQAPAEAVPVLPASGGGGLPLVGVLGLVFGAIAMVGVLALVPRTTGKASWLGQLEGYRLRPGREAQAESSSGVTRAALSVTDRLVSGGLEERLALKLDRAGMSMKPHEWALVSACVCVVSIVLFGALFRNLAVGLFAGVPFGWLATRVYLSRRAEKRLATFADQLPDALQLVAGSLRTGFSLSQAIDGLAGEEMQPLSSEMARALAESRLGVPIEDTLEKVSWRMECPDLRWVVMAVRIQREVGGNLAEVLDTTIETMRERSRLRRHVKALSAEGRLSAYILIALPIVTGFALFLLRPEYVRPLVSTPLGLLMLIMAGGLMGVGWFWMSRMVKVEV